VKESLTSRVGRIISGSLSALVAAVENAAPEAVMEETIQEIEGIKIIQVEGLAGGGSGAPTAGEAQANLADQLVSSVLRYRGQAPLVDSLLSEIGLRAGDLNGLTREIGPEATDEHESPQSAQSSRHSS
jgi:uncharacterized membrane protein YqiK